MLLRIVRMQSNSSVEEMNVVSDVEDLEMYSDSKPDEADEADAVEAPGKRSRENKLPARFRDSDFVPSTSFKEDQFEATMKDSKFIHTYSCKTHYSLAGPVPEISISHVDIGILLLHVHLTKIILYLQGSWVSNVIKLERCTK